MQSLATEDLTVLADVIEQGTRECQWTERESTAVKALTCAFDQEMQRAGFRQWLNSRDPVPPGGEMGLKYQATRVA